VRFIAGTSRHGFQRFGRSRRRGAQERNDIAGAAFVFHLFAEGSIAIVGIAGLSPAHQRFDARVVECGSDGARRMRQIEFDAIAIGQIAGLAVATIVDRIAFKPGIDQPA
jgi:hypothetical protein